MNKKEAVAKLSEMVTKAESIVDECVTFADEHGLEFIICEQEYVGTNKGNRLTVEDYWDGTTYDDLDEDDPRIDEEYQYSGWQNSSTFC